MQPGDTLAHYTIGEKIGQGGMGEVHRARDNKLDRDVAVKILPPGFDHDPERLARFQREARTLAALQHPNVASVYGLETAGGQTFLVMELVVGEDLSQRLARGALPVERVVEIAVQIATGLEAAHDKGIVHRDLKPANIKLGSDGAVKILDFGLARAYEGDPEQTDSSATQPTLTAAMTGAGVILGTAAYMSPEQARGKTLDRRTDIFSFGAVLYEMLTGARPFGGETLSDTLASVLKEQPDRSALPTDTPAALRLLLDRCLEKDARKRLRDIGEARLILAAVHGGDATASVILGRAGVPDPAGADGPNRIRPREMAAWALGILAVAALGIVFLGAGDTPPPPRAVHNLSVPIPGETDLRFTHGGLVISPDGARIAYINRHKLYVRRMDSWDPIEIPQSEGASSPFWSPDGQALGFAIDRDLLTVRPDGTQRKVIGTAEVAFSRTSGGAWLADDRIVFRGDKDLMVVPASGGSITTFVSAADTGIVDFHEPDALPGGRGLVVGVHTSGGVNTLGLVTLDGALHTFATYADWNIADPCYSPSGHILFQEKGVLWAVAFSLARQEVRGEPFPVARNTAVPSVANDGTLAYVRNAGEILRRLVLVDRTGRIVDRLGQPDDLWGCYALAPDGTRAVGMQSVSTDLFLHDNRQARTRATFTGLEHDMVSFSWDGLTAYFSTGTEHDYRIGSKTVDRNEPEQLLVPPGELGPHFFASCPAVTRDGKRLFYSAIGADGKQDIAWLELGADAKPQRFLAGDAAEYAARPSPADPRYVAYVSEESGSQQVYLTTWPDADRKLPVSLDGGLWPRWKGDGSELFFAAGNDIFAVEVGYEPLRLGNPRKLFARPEYDDRQSFGWPATFDVTADGQRFLVTELVVDENADPSIAIVQNWAAALE